MNPSRSEAPNQSVGLDQNHFQLLGLPTRYPLDLNQLDEARQRIQAVVHPDRFAAAGPAQKRLALQWSTRIHEAYETLRQPLSRASYLLALKGEQVNAECNTQMSGVFLEQQMAWRESFEAAQGLAGEQRLAAMASLRSQCEAALEQGLDRLTDLLGKEDPQALQDAAAEVRALMFVERFREGLR